MLSTLQVSRVVLGRPLSSCAPRSQRALQALPLVPYLALLGHGRASPAAAADADPSAAASANLRADTRSMRG